MAFTVTAPTGLIDGVPSCRLPHVQAHVRMTPMGDDAAEASSGGHRVGPKMPFEISGAVAEAEQLGDTRSQVAGQHPGLDDDPLSLGPEGQPASPRLTDLGRFVLAGARSRLLTEIVDSLVQGTR